MWIILPKGKVSLITRALGAECFNGQKKIKKPDETKKTTWCRARYSRSS